MLRAQSALDVSDRERPQLRVQSFTLENETERISRDIREVRLSTDKAPSQPPPIAMKRIWGRGLKSKVGCNVDEKALKRLNV
jgi:hypothetical protein